MEAAQPSVADAVGLASFILTATAADLEEALLVVAAALVALAAEALAAADLGVVGNWNPIEPKLKKKE